MVSQEFNLKSGLGAVHVDDRRIFVVSSVNVLPVVMGARREDYEAMAPPHSFIHVEDFKSARDLAAYLHLLDLDDNLYNKYFQWKNTGYFLNTKFWCRMCAMAHGVDETHAQSHWFDDVDMWWRNGTCVEDRWDDPKGKILSFSNSDENIDY